MTIEMPFSSYENNNSSMRSCSVCMCVQSKYMKHGMRNCVFDIIVVSRSFLITYINRQ